MVREDEAALTSVLAEHLAGAPPSAAGTGTFSASLPTADVPVTWLGWSVWAPYEAKVPSPKKMTTYTTSMSTGMTTTRVWTIIH